MQISAPSSSVADRGVASVQRTPTANNSNKSNNINNMDSDNNNMSAHEERTRAHEGDYTIKHVFDHTHASVRKAISRPIIVGLSPSLSFPGYRHS